jgi:hypothetical protein
MSPFAKVHVTVLEPVIDWQPTKLLGTCQLLVSSEKQIPKAPYQGTVRIGGTEETVTGHHPCRILKHFTIEHVEDGTEGSFYRLVVDLSHEWPGLLNTPLPNGYGERQVAESVAVICKRIAGLFGRHCEDYRPPSVVVRLRSDLA